MSYYHNIMSPKASKGLFPKILVNDVRNIPINASDSETVEKISGLVKKMLEEGEVDAGIDDQIDELVYDLYKITAEEKDYIKKWYMER